MDVLDYQVGAMKLKVQLSGFFFNYSRTLSGPEKTQA
jgi:hypothetical protein